MLPRIMSGFMVHQHPVSVLTFMTYIATKGHKDALMSELPPVAISVSKGHATTRAMLI